MEVNVGNAVTNSFDPKVFLAKVGKGKTILEFHSNQIVFAQGEVADTVFTFKKAESNSLFCLSRARKRWSGF
jgi:CRP/FNR family cyclic AMP-dependent transcriptional regulator